MNTARILAGGAVAGLIMNVSEAALHAVSLGPDSEQLYKTLNVPLPSPAANVPVLIGATFRLGFVAIWLYAAIRPRFGPGARTAVIAGVMARGKGNAQDCGYSLFGVWYQKVAAALRTKSKKTIEPTPFAASACRSVSSVGTTCGIRTQHVVQSAAARFTAVRPRDITKHCTGPGPRRSL